MFFLRLNYFFLNQLFHSFNNGFKKNKIIIRPLFDGSCGALTFFVLFCNTFVLVSQQTSLSSQYRFNELSLNPAYAGSSELVNLVAGSRQQWVGVSGGPKTTVFGADFPINFLGNEAGLGIVFSNDQIGFFNEIAINLMGSAIFRLQDGMLNAGVSMGVINHVLKPEWYLGDKYGLSDFHSNQDGLMVSSELSGNAFDLGIGVFYQTHNWHAGFSVLHLFNPQPDFDDNYFHYFRRTFYATGGYEFAIPDRPIVLKPSVLLMSDVASYQGEIDMTATFKKRYWGGLGYRFQDAVIVLLGIEMKNGLKIGYSYDIPASQFAANYGGSHEIMVGYQFDLRIDKKGKSYKSVRFL